LRENKGWRDHIAQNQNEPPSRKMSRCPCPSVEAFSVTVQMIYPAEGKNIEMKTEMQVRTYSRTTFSPRTDRDRQFVSLEQENFSLQTSTLVSSQNWHGMDGGSSRLSELLYPSEGWQCHACPQHRFRQKEASEADPGPSNERRIMRLCSKNPGFATASIHAEKRFFG